MIRIYDTARNYDLFSIGSTVAVQQEDGGLWTQGTIVGDHNDKNRSYTIKITRTGDISKLGTVNILKQHPSQLNNISGINPLNIQVILWCEAP